MPHPRDPETVKRNLSATQAALKQREDKCVRHSLPSVFLLPFHRQGQTVEEIAVDVNRTEEKWMTADTDLKQMAALNKVCIRYSPCSNLFACSVNPIDAKDLSPKKDAKMA